MNRTIIHLILLLGIIGGCTTISQEYRDSEYHIHIDFKVYVEDKFINFSQDKYMSKEVPLHQYIHLHDMDGYVLHFHEASVSIYEFFESVNMSLNETCFVTDEGEEFCSNEEYSLEMYVNEEKIGDIMSYHAQDLDRVLVIYSNKSEEEKLVLAEQVTDLACIQSLVCPERGEAYDESSCAGTSCVYEFE